MRIDSRVAVGESNRQSSTAVACCEKSAKLTPSPSQVAPSGCGLPGRVRMPSDLARHAEDVRDLVRRIETNVVLGAAPVVARARQEIGYFVWLFGRDTQRFDWKFNHCFVRAERIDVYDDQHVVTGCPLAIGDDRTRLGLQ